MLCYVDTSAVIKLIHAERESAALHDWIADNQPDLVASELLRTELMRSGRRVGVIPFNLEDALGAIDFLPATSALFRAAGELLPNELRSLDALHVATAIELRDTCDGVVTYDERMANAAQEHDLEVIAPA